MKQSAVEWLVDKLESEYIIRTYDLLSYRSIVQQALEIEKDNLISESNSNISSNLQELSPKQKAEDLIEQFKSIKPLRIDEYSPIQDLTARHCALIVVNQIMCSIHPHTNEWEYWNNVKQNLIDK